MKTKIIVSVAGLLCMASLLAHECWIQPHTFFVSPGTALPFSIMVGENFSGEHWANRKTRTRRLLLFSASRTESLLEKMPTQDTIPLTATLIQPGTYLIYLHSHASYIELDAEKFNAYLKEDGISNILQRRENNKETNKPAREKYERFAKTFVQCGNVVSDITRKKTGDKLEMLLGSNPYQQKNNLLDSLEILVQFDGKPLSNKQVTVWQKDETGKFLGKTNYATDVKGQFFFQPDKKAIYLISTVHMIPAKDTSYDYHSYWGSVSFELK